MGKYSVRVEKAAAKELEKLYKSGNKADISRIEKIFRELEEHPQTGIGKPEALKHDLGGLWSRRINMKDRLIYEIVDKEILVIVLSAQGHYFDK